MLGHSDDLFIVANSVTRPAAGSWPQATEEEYHNMMQTNVDSCWFLCTMAESPAFKIYI